MKGLKADGNSNADDFEKELENIMRSLEKLDSSFSEMQADVKALKSRRINAETQISDLEDRTMKITQSGQWAENQTKKHERKITDLWDNIKWPNLAYYKSRRREKEKRIANIFEETVAQNVPSQKQTNIKIQEAQCSSTTLNPNRPPENKIKIAKVDCF